MRFRLFQQFYLRSKKESEKKKTGICEQIPEYIYRNSCDQDPLVDHNGNTDEHIPCIVVFVRTRGKGYEPVDVIRNLVGNKSGF